MYVFNVVWAKLTILFATKESLKWYIDIAGDAHVIKSEGRNQTRIISQAAIRGITWPGFVRRPNLFFDIWLLKAVE